MRITEVCHMNNKESLIIALQKILSDLSLNNSDRFVLKQLLAELTKDK